MEVWRSLSCPYSAIQLAPTLLGGQSFRWKCLKEGHYIGVFQSIVWEVIQGENEIKYRTHGNHNFDDGGINCLLKRYLRLDENLGNLIDNWSQKDPAFQEIDKKFHGVRMLRQDVIENVFSFICSSNNNIPRITSLVEKLCALYGKHIVTIDGIRYNTFPHVAQLAGPKVEAELREAGFGYRAGFIHKSASLINAKGQQVWVDNLTSLDYSKAKEELLTLTGVGRKVADCICLMSLGHLEAVPVDTHILQIVKKNYLPHIKEKKTLTNKTYDEVGDFFRNLFGPYAGWAQTILFCDDLKSLKTDKRKLPERKSVKRKKARNEGGS